MAPANSLQIDTAAHNQQPAHPHSTTLPAHTQLCAPFEICYNALSHSTQHTAASAYCAACMFDIPELASCIPPAAEQPTNHAVQLLQTAQQLHAPYLKTQASLHAAYSTHLLSISCCPQMLCCRMHHDTAQARCNRTTSSLMHAVLTAAVT